MVLRGFGFNQGRSDLDVFVTTRLEVIIAPNDVRGEFVCFLMCARACVRARARAGMPACASVSVHVVSMLCMYAYIV